MLLFFFPLYLLRVLGAGDVKLLAFVGGALGVRSEHWSHLVGVSLSVLVAGGLLALIRTFSGGRSALVFSNLRLIVAGWMLRTRGMPGPRFDPASDTADRLPYAYAITAGVSVYITASSSGIV